MSDIKADAVELVEREAKDRAKHIKEWFVWRLIEIAERDKIPIQEVWDNDVYWI